MDEGKAMKQKRGREKVQSLLMVVGRFHQKVRLITMIYDLKIV